MYLELNDNDGLNRPGKKWVLCHLEGEKLLIAFLAHKTIVDYNSRWFSAKVGGNKFL